METAADLLERKATGAAAEHLTRRVPVVAPGSRAGEIRRVVSGGRFDYAGMVAVCDNEKLLGLIRVEELFASPDERTADGLMDTSPPVVAASTDREIAAWRAFEQNKSAVAVVDEQGRFLGLMPPDELIGVLVHEHQEDMARLGGFLKSASTARRASEEAVLRRLWHRIPWLIMGLAGAFVAADIVGSFQSQLQENVILAFFIPGIVYMADAVGTQTETLIVRGLSVGVPMSRVVWRELLTGLLVGGALALLFFPIGLWRWRQADVALTVSLALLFACSTATVVAMALPWVLYRLGRDPAFGSGPLATVIQDLLSIIIYFAIALAVVG